MTRRARPQRAARRPRQRHHLRRPGRRRDLGRLQALGQSRAQHDLLIGGAGQRSSTPATAATDPGRRRRRLGQGPLRPRDHRLRRAAPTCSTSAPRAAAIQDPWVRDHLAHHAWLLRAGRPRVARRAERPACSSCRRRSARATTCPPGSSPTGCAASGRIRRAHRGRPARHGLADRSRRARRRADGLARRGAVLRLRSTGSTRRWRPRGAWAAGCSRRWAAGGCCALIAAERPDVVVVDLSRASSEALGRLRRRGRLDVPVASAITDLAGLRYWAHPGIDLHLVIHPRVDRGGARDRRPASRIVVGQRHDGAATSSSRAIATTRAARSTCRPRGRSSSSRAAAGRWATWRARPRPRCASRAPRSWPVRPQRGGARAPRRALRRRGPRCACSASPIGWATGSPPRDALVHSTVGPDRARGDHPRLPGDLLRLGARAHPRQQPRLPRASAWPRSPPRTPSSTPPCAARSPHRPEPDLSLTRIPSAAAEILATAGR